MEHAWGLLYGILENDEDGPMENVDVLTKQQQFHNDFQSLTATVKNNKMHVKRPDANKDITDFEKFVKDTPFEWVGALFTTTDDPKLAIEWIGTIGQANGKSHDEVKDIVKKMSFAFKGRLELCKAELKRTQEELVEAKMETKKDLVIGRLESELKTFKKIFSSVARNNNNQDDEQKGGGAGNQDEEKNIAFKAETMVAYIAKQNKEIASLNAAKMNMDYKANEYDALVKAVATIRQEDKDDNVKQMVWSTTDLAGSERESYDVNVIDIATLPTAKTIVGSYAALASAYGKLAIDSTRDQAKWNATKQAWQADKTKTSVTEVTFHRARAFLYQKLLSLSEELKQEAIVVVTEVGQLSEKEEKIRKWLETFNITVNGQNNDHADWNRLVDEANVMITGIDASQETKDLNVTSLQTHITNQFLIAKNDFTTKLHTFKTEHFNAKDLEATVRDHEERAKFREKQTAIAMRLLTAHRKVTADNKRQYEQVMRALAAMHEGNVVWIKLAMQTEVPDQKEYIAKITEFDNFIETTMNPNNLFLDLSPLLTIDEDNYATELSKLGPYEFYMNEVHYIAIAEWIKDPYKNMDKYDNELNGMFDKLKSEWGKSSVHDLQIQKRMQEELTEAQETNKWLISVVKALENVNDNPPLEDGLPNMPAIVARQIALEASRVGTIGTNRFSDASNMMLRVERTADNEIQKIRVQYENDHLKLHAALSKLETWSKYTEDYDTVKQKNKVMQDTLESWMAWSCEILTVLAKLIGEKENISSLLNLLIERQQDDLRWTVQGNNTDVFSHADREASRDWMVKGTDAINKYLDNFRGRSVAVASHVSEGNNEVNNLEKKLRRQFIDHMSRDNPCKQLEEKKEEARAQVDEHFQNLKELLKCDEKENANEKTNLRIAESSTLTAFPYTHQTCEIRKLWMQSLMSFLNKWLNSMFVNSSAAMSATFLRQALAKIHLNEAELVEQKIVSTYDRYLERIADETKAFLVRHDTFARDNASAVRITSAAKDLGLNNMKEVADWLASVRKESDNGRLVHNPVQPQGHAHASVFMPSHSKPMGKLFKFCRLMAGACDVELEAILQVGIFELANKFYNVVNGLSRQTRGREENSRSIESFGRNFDEQFAEMKELATGLTDKVNGNINHYFGRVMTPAAYASVCDTIEFLSRSTNKPLPFKDLYRRNTFAFLCGKRFLLTRITSRPDLKFTPRQRNTVNREWHDLCEEVINIIMS